MIIRPSQKEVSTHMKSRENSVWVLTCRYQNNSIKGVFNRPQDAVQEVKWMYSPERLSKQAPFEVKIEEIGDNLVHITCTSPDFYTPSFYDITRYEVK